MMMNNHELKEMLHNGVITVVFTKADGTDRTMRCTLVSEYMPIRQDSTPGQQLLKENLTSNRNTDTISVWDIDNQAWRSFRVDSVKQVMT